MRSLPDGSCRGRVLLLVKRILRHEKGVLRHVKGVLYMSLLLVEGRLCLGQEGGLCV